VQSLPNGAVDQTVGSVTYFTYGGAWYRPMYSAGGVRYTVVAKPVTNGLKCTFRHNISEGIRHVRSGRYRVSIRGKAEEVRQKLFAMQKDYLIELGDAVIALSSLTAR